MVTLEEADFLDEKSCQAFRSRQVDDLKIVGVRKALRDLFDVVARHQISLCGGGRCRKKIEYILYRGCGDTWKEIGAVYNFSPFDRDEE